MIILMHYNLLQTDIILKECVLKFFIIIRLQHNLILKATKIQEKCGKSCYFVFDFVPY